jgi:hypothetical protein
MNGMSEVEVLDEPHRRALAWFEQHAGETMPWPKPLTGGQFLATKAKGIYRPKDWRHALSIRVIPAGPYPDDDPVQTAAGGWRFRYHQEEWKGTDPAKYFTNLGLAACIADSMPVGVLRQTRPKPGPLYTVVGLGRVTDWSGGFFTIEGPVTLAGALQAQGAEPVAPTSLDDARRKVLAEIARRQGQPAFRSALMAAYGGRCAVSGCAVAEVLEAAHIVPYLGPHTNGVTNGLLLRSDIHSLFDLGLLTIDPEGFTVRVAPQLTGSSYGELDGRTLRLPADPKQRPGAAAFADREKVLKQG